MTKACLTLCDSMYHIAPGFPDLNYLLEFAQTHVHWVSDAIQPSHLLQSPFPPALLPSFPASRSFPISQLFPSSGQSIGVSALASVLPMNIHGCFPLWLIALIFLQSKGLSRVFSNITTWKHQFFCAHPSLESNSHICTWLLEKSLFDYTDLCQ